MHFGFNYQDQELVCNKIWWASCSTKDVKGSHIKSGALQLVLIHGWPHLPGPFRYFSWELPFCHCGPSFFSALFHMAASNWWLVLCLHIHSVGLKACSESFCFLSLGKFTRSHVLLQKTQVLSSIPNSGHQRLLPKVKDLIWDAPMQMQASSHQ